MTDSVTDRPSTGELLECQADQLRLVAEQLANPCDPLLDAAEAAACVHAITATALRRCARLPGWHTSHVDELFEHEGDAEHNATALARASAKKRRAFAGELEAVAAGHRDLIADLRGLTHRRSSVSELSCSRQISAIDRSPRKDASTSSTFCFDVNLRNSRLSLNTVS
jgi:hypothetical protein